ncbi:MAG: hypothetical protein ABSG89_09095 [Bacteroidales bacterium]
MENDERQLTGEESLRIITDMINKTKTNIRHGSFHLIFWGWLIIFCSLMQFILARFPHFHSPWTVWSLVIPGIFVSLIYGWVNGRKEHVHTYADTVYMMSWIGFVIVALILFLFLHGNEDLVPQYILLAAGFPTFVSGFVLRFKPLIFGGIAFWILSLVAFFAGVSVAQLTVPVAMLTGYLVPGYMLRRKDSHDAV